MTLKPGIRIGPYEILSPLSVVGLGDIHRARDHEQGRDVVIQVLRIATDADPALLPRLAADVLEAGVLTHPSIPKIYDVGTTADTVYIVCEPFDGETLQTLADRGDLTVDAATECITQVASALAVAGTQRISHGNLRAENVLVTSDRRTVVLGFGMAAATGGDDPSDEVAFEALCRGLLPEGPPVDSARPWWRRPAVTVAVGLLVLPIAIGVSLVVMRTGQRAGPTFVASDTIEDDPLTLNDSVANSIVPPSAQSTEAVVEEDALVPEEEGAEAEFNADADGVAGAAPATTTEPPELATAVPNALPEFPPEPATDQREPPSETATPSQVALAAATDPLEGESGEGIGQIDTAELTDEGGAEPLVAPGDAAPAETPAVAPVLDGDGRDARSLIAEVIVRAAAFDLPGALELLGVTARRGDAGSEVGLIYLRGLVDAREAFQDGGTVAALAPVYGAIEALATLSQGRRGSAEIARLVLQAAAAAAQSERDEMRRYLETAMQMEVIQSAGRLPGAPRISAPEIAGDLWLQVDRYEDARQLYDDAADRVGPSLRNMLGSARASRRLKDVLAACTSYEAVLETWGAGPGAPPEIAEAQTYIDTVCMSAEVPDADAPG